jgi:hypothetical protein
MTNADFRKKGREEVAFSKGLLLMEKAFDGALDAGADPEEMLKCVELFVIHGTDRHSPARATRENAFERQSQTAPRTGETPVRGMSFIAIQEKGAELYRQMRKPEKPVMSLEQAFKVLRERGYTISRADASDTGAAETGGGGEGRP